MIIWIDADACPKAVKELVFRASQRLTLRVIMVADRPLQLPRSRLVSSQVVSRGMDSADKHIVDHMAPGDLVITADIPLAAQVVEKGGNALNPRGELYDSDNMGERLAMRDLLMGLREQGMELGGPAGFGPKDRQRFAEALDRFLTASLK